MSKLTILIVIFLIYNSLSFAMEKKPYHHLPDGTFRNPEGSPERNSNFKWSFRTYNKEKKKLNMTITYENIVEKLLEAGAAIYHKDHSGTMVKDRSFIDKKIKKLIDQQDKQIKRLFTEIEKGKFNEPLIENCLPLLVSPMLFSITIFISLQRF